MENCVFCKIVKGEISSYKIYENEHVLAFLSAGEEVDGHTLVIPKVHAENIYDCPPAVLAEVIKAVKVIGEHYKTLGYTGINIINASGKDAEQSVMHLHFHILPRKENDGIKAWPVLKGASKSLEDNHNFFKLK